MNADGTIDINLLNLPSGSRLDMPADVGTDRATWPGFVPPYSDAVKVSAQSDIRAKFGTVFSGKENCADINNRSRDIVLKADLWVANGGFYPFTIKGGARGISISGRLQGHGTECDVDAGNWSDQNHDWVRDWELALISTDGKPIVVRCLGAEKPRLVPGTGPYYFIFPDPDKCYHPLVVAAFNQLHRCGLFK